MKTILKLIIFFALIVLIMGCTTTKTTVISTNNFRQTDYNFQCLEGNKTFTQIIVCFQTQDDAEKTQNKITNELLDQN